MGPDFSLGPPGYSLRVLLARLDPFILNSLCDGAAELIELLGGARLSPDELSALVLDIHDGVDIVRRPAVRRQLLDLLPNEKKSELALRLPDRVEPDDIARCDYPVGSDEEQALMSFLGLSSAPATGPSSRAGTLTKHVPEYGLFDYQRRAVEHVERLLAEFPRRVVLHLPTGAGKTRCAMHVAAEHLANAGPTVVVWLAYNQELLEQAASEFERAWGHLGNRPVAVARLWGDGNVDLSPVNDGFVAGGLSKLYALYEREPSQVLQIADRTTLTIFDEAHQAVAPTYRELAELFSGKRPDGRLLGLTATPGRTWSDISKDEVLAEFFARRKVTLEVRGYDNPVSFLIENGYLARPTFRTLNSRSGVKLSHADVRELAAALDVSNAILKRIGESRQYTARVVQATLDLFRVHRRIIVFASSVEQAKRIAAVLTGLGTRAAAVTAETPHGERRRVVRAFQSNSDRPMALINFGVLTTGFDAPQTSAAIIARPTKSLVLFSQMVGRAIRGTRAGGNKECEILTVVDPDLPGFGDIADAFANWEDVWG